MNGGIAEGLMKSDVSQQGSISEITGASRERKNMESLMTSKGFDLLIAMILEMLKSGQTDKVIKLLEETRTESSEKK